MLVALASCSKDDSVYDIKCDDNEIVYQTKYGYPIEIESEMWDDAFGSHLVENISKDGYCRLIFDNDITFIPASAFSGIDVITFIKLPNSVVSIMNSAFRNCIALQRVVLGENISSIEQSAFYNCSSLKSITIPKNITSIRSAAFDGCNSLSSVNISDLSAWCKISFGSNSANPLNNGAKLYINGSELTKITIPSDITEIKGYAFCGCSSLKSVTIHKNVTSIGRYAFYDCSSLASVYCKPTTPPTGGSCMFDGNASDRRIYVSIDSFNAYKVADVWCNYNIVRHKF